MDFPRAEKLKSEPLLPALGPCCSAKDGVPHRGIPVLPPAWHEGWG